MISHCERNLGRVKKTRGDWGPKLDCFVRLIALSLRLQHLCQCRQLDQFGLQIFYEELACVASVSNRVIARKLEREQKKKKVEGGGGGEKRKRLPANPTILENAP